MKANLRGMSLLALVLGLLTVATPIEAEPRSDDADPWGQIVYDNQGRFMAATGQERGGVAVSLSTSSEVHGDRGVTRIAYQRGPASLSIERTYQGSTGLDTVFETGSERLVVSMAFDDLTGETLVVYHFPSGEVHSLWMAESGEILSGDIHGLRRALREPMEITRLLRSYVRQKEPFTGELPAAGEKLLLPMRSCLDVCAMGCPAQCSWECAAFGDIGCQVCMTACAVGCAIGCYGG